MALVALVKPLAGIGRHDFGLGVPTFRAGQYRFENHLIHGFVPAMVDGKPASLVARVIVATFTLASS